MSAHADDATRAAVAALAHRVRSRDASDDPTDPDVFALEFLTALRGQGWRLTEARPAQWHQRPADGAIQLTPSEEFRLAREHIARRNRGVVCEACCPCRACDPPNEDPTCRCAQPCGAENCPAGRSQS
jgi:hypothetical protein